MTHGDWIGVVGLMVVVGGGLLTILMNQNKNIAIIKRDLHWVKHLLRKIAPTSVIPESDEAGAGSD